jgi:hypothetical protein
MELSRGSIRIKGNGYQMATELGLSHRLCAEGGNRMNLSIMQFGKEAPNMNFLCSGCGKREGEPQGWRLVIEMGKPGTDIRNTIFILDQWDEKRALNPNAACFCSIECETHYLAVRHQQLVA